jgi:hypothetical protein
MGAAGLLQPRMQDGRVAVGRLSQYQYSRRDMNALGRRTPAIRYAASKAVTAPVVIRIGSFCKQR